MHPCYKHTKREVLAQALVGLKFPASEHRFSLSSLFGGEGCTDAHYIDIEIIYKIYMLSIIYIYKCIETTYTYEYSE